MGDSGGDVVYSCSCVTRASHDVFSDDGRRSSLHFSVLPYRIEDVYRFQLCLLVFRPSIFTQNTGSSALSVLIHSSSWLKMTIGGRWRTVFFRTWPLREKKLSNPLPKPVAYSFDILMSTKSAEEPEYGMVSFSSIVDSNTGDLHHRDLPFL
jgi:hypothetical protein